MLRELRTTFPCDMSEQAPPPHPPEFRQLCEEAAGAFLALAADEPSRRGARIPGVRALLQRIEERLEALDLGTTPDFDREQGLVVDAASALQSIDLDRGGPHVARYARRAAADLWRIAGGPA